MGALHDDAYNNTVSQATNLTTAVTLNANCGQITTQSATTGAVTTQSFTLNNTYIKANSTPVVSLISYAGTYQTNGTPLITVDTVAAGSCVIRVSNVHASNALSGVLIIGFFVG